MAEMFEMLIRGAVTVSHAGIVAADIGVRDGRTAAIGDLSAADAEEVVDAKGLHLLPGIIDTQVHFREPGNEHKEDLESGSRAAVLGGVTAVFEMPNTKPSTTTAEALAHKLDRARQTMWCDHAFYVGASEENIGDLATLERLPGCCGVKMFMGASTGDLLVHEDQAISKVLAAGSRRIAVHSEDEARMRERKSFIEPGNVHSHLMCRDDQSAILATERLLKMARAAKRKIHVLHVTTGEEMTMLGDNKDIATVEVTPQHLTLAAPDCYDALGSRAQMNPPIRGANQRAALWQALQDGVVDVIGTDHAPHTLEEKAGAYPNSPSGMPGVQTLTTIMLDHVNAGRLSLQHFVDLTSAGPARVFQLAGKGRLAIGYDADYTLVDLEATRTIEDSDMATKSGWTPYAGMKTKGWPVGTIIRGNRVMWEGALGERPQAKPMRFIETL